MDGEPIELRLQEPHVLLSRLPPHLHDLEQRGDEDGRLGGLGGAGAPVHRHLDLVAVGVCRAGRRALRHHHRRWHSHTEHGASCVMMMPSGISAKRRCHLLSFSTSMAVKVKRSPTDTVELAMDGTEEEKRETPASGGEEEEDGSRVHEVAGEAALEETEDGGVSKRQRKKMLRQKLWEEGRDQRRLQRKQRRQRRKQEGDEPTRKRVHAEPAPSGVRVAIDCGFDHLMLLRDVKKLHKQIQRCYAENRRAPRSVQLLLTSHSGQLKSNMDAHDRGYLNWKGIEVRGERVEEAVPVAELVYLTSESPHTLASVESGRTYVIGGLVDHNHHKGLTLQKAEELRVEHARLPLDDYVKMASRKVLTVNHVFEILLAFLDLGDWGCAFLRVLPDRKQVVPISHNASLPATTSDSGDESGCRGADTAVVKNHEHRCQDDANHETGGREVNRENRESGNAETGDASGLETGGAVNVEKRTSVNLEKRDPVNPQMGDPDVNPMEKESATLEIHDSLRLERGDDAVNMEKTDSLNA